jgi:hypothetical protein
MSHPRHSAAGRPPREPPPDAVQPSQGAGPAPAAGPAAFFGALGARSVFEVAGAIDRLLSLPPGAWFLFEQHYREHWRFTAREYRAVVRARAGCFSRTATPEFDRALAAALAPLVPGLRADAFVALSAHVLRHERGAGHGLLLVLDCALRNFAWTRAALARVRAGAPGAAPVLTWVLARLAAGRAVSLGWLLRHFGRCVLAPHPRMDDLAVNLAHVLADAARPAAHVRAAEYVKLVRLSQRTATPRDRHVRDALAPAFFAVRVADVEQYPRALMLEFPECPPFVHSIFVSGAARDARFLRGWLREFRGPNRGLAARYLHAVANRMPLRVLRAFPEATRPVVEEERQRVRLLEQRLALASRRFVIALAVSIVICWYWCAAP